MLIAVTRLAAAGSLLVVLSSGLHAQATVSGVLSLEERAGAERGDINSAVVYLEPRSRAIPVNVFPARRSRTIGMPGREFRPHLSIGLAGGASRSRTTTHSV